MNHSYMYIYIKKGVREAFYLVGKRELIYSVENPNRNRNSSLLNPTKPQSEEMPLYCLIHSVRYFLKSNQ